MSNINNKSNISKLIGEINESEWIDKLLIEMNKKG
jgi:hypothetical protein